MNYRYEHPLFHPDGETPGPSRRDGKSVALSSGIRSAKEEGPSLDAANQSLADALRLIFVLLNSALVVIAAFYVLSGFQQVKEGESGIRLLFGKVDAAGLEPGFHFAMPYPIGVLEKIQTGNESIQLYSEFWPNAEGADASKKIEELPPTPQLTPGKDGSLITSDLNLAHARWVVTYVRANPTEYAGNIYPGATLTDSKDETKAAKKEPINEQNIVRSAVSRGVVQAVASTDLESLTKQSGSDAGSVSARAKQIAQESLDRIHSGIRIEKLDLEAKSPPTYALTQWNAVQTAEQKAGQQRESAMQYRQNALNSTAGAAAVPLLDLIDRFDRASELGNKAEQDEALKQIDAILQRDPKQVEAARTALDPELLKHRGEPDADAKILAATVVTSGEVRRIVDEANQYSRNSVALRQRERDRFIAKLEQFKYNPVLTIHREWSEAYTAFMSRDNVFKMYLPRGVQTLNLMVNPDPDILRNIVKARQAAEVTAAEIKREQDRQKANSETLKGLQGLPSSQ